MNWSFKNIKEGPVSTGIGIVMILSSIVLAFKDVNGAYPLALLAGGIAALGLKK